MERKIYMDMFMDEVRPVSPGSPAFFRLRIATNRPIQILAGQARFLSYDRCLQSVGLGQSVDTAEMVKHEEYGQRSLTLYLHDTLRDRFQPHGYFLVDKNQGSNRGTLKVHENKPYNAFSVFNLRVRLDLPEDIPDTWAFHSRYHGRVRNTVEALATYMRLDGHTVFPFGEMDSDVLPIMERVLWAGQDVPVRNAHVPIERFGCQRVIEDKVVLRVGFPGFWGRIQCLLTVCDRLGKRGHDLPLEAEINNDSSKILREVSLAFYKEYTFRDYKPELYVPVYTEEEKVFEFSLPSILPHTHRHREITHFTIPSGFMTSESVSRCTFVDLRFLVRLKVKWRLFGSLKCEVPILLGTQGVRAVPTVPRALEPYELRASTASKLLPRLHY